MTDFFELSPQESEALWRAVGAAKQVIDARHHPNGYRVQFDVARAPNQHTPHLLVHIVPQYGSASESPASDALASESPATQLTVGPSAPLGPQLLNDLDGALCVDIAVAFVFTAGLNGGVLARLRDVLSRAGSRVRLLTGDYQCVTEPAALRLLLNLKEQVAAHTRLRRDNIDAGLEVKSEPELGGALEFEGEPEFKGELELRVFETERAGRSFHPKAYLFYSDLGEGALATYVGSSNLSRTALFDGVEWNLRRSDADTSALARAEFEQLFAHDCTRALTHEWVDAYIQRRPIIPEGQLRPDVPEAEDPPPSVPQPSPVQLEALEALEATREAGNRAGLVVLATGLGKTWLSAFDSTEERGFRRVLFVAHRQEILGQAMATFARIRPTSSAGLYTGEEKTPNAELLFASIQTLSQEHHLAKFAPEHFDYIVVDEFHHAAAATYRRVLDHFEPKFLLALTATPERTDGGDLLSLCDENVVFECGLAPGVRQKLLSPFHYFGVPDMVEYGQIPWRSRRFDEEALTLAVATNERAQNALDQLRALGGTRTVGFCVSQRHADFMRDYFREHTELRCASVHSGPTSDSRARALEDLSAGQLDVLFCVDMFNEGLDVPSIDTVLMLRPTESKVIWLQQLGRGLRKHESKTHLRVIDYIGNHRSFLEKPAALLAALGVTVTSPQQLTQLLEDRNFDLPEGCEVTYSLEARQILERLCPPSKATQTLRDWYEAFREHAQRRPTAREAVHSGYAPSSVHHDYGTWLEFVAQMGDLSARAADALKLDRDFLHWLETRQTRRSHELVLLDALRSAGALPGSTNISTLTDAFTRRVRRSAALSNDIPVSLGDAKALSKFLREGPLRSLARAELPSGKAVLVQQADVVRTEEALLGRSPELQELVAELLEWRLSEYLSRKPRQPVFDVGQNNQGEPILKLDRTRYELPQDWVLVAADSATYRAHYGKHFVDAATAADKNQEKNQLTGLLRGWFGPDAGARSAKHRVVQRTDASGRPVWKPLIPAVLHEDDGTAIDATFDSEDFDGQPTIVFHSRGGDRNSEYSRGLEVLLQRLASAGVTVQQIAVESGGTRTLPLAQRLIQMDGFEFPLDPREVEDFQQLRTRIGRAGAALGRAPGAKGGGNSNKRLRIWLEREVSEEWLARGKEA